MNIVLFGATGFVGRHLLRRLSRDGHRMTVVTRNHARWRELAVIPGVRLVQRDPHDPAQVRTAIEGHEAVISLAGILNERGFSGRGFERVHVALPQNIVNACRETGVQQRLLHMSALGAERGQSHYLRTKGQAEDLIRLARHVDATILRPSVIFGPDDSFLNRFAALLKISPVLPLACPGARFAPVFVDDVAEAFARTLTSRQAIGETFELCGPETFTLIEIVSWIQAQLGLKRAVIGLPDWAGWLQGRMLDFVPGKPFSSDNFKSLKLDSICQRNDFERLGIAPRPMTRLAPTWLGKDSRQARLREYRRHAGRHD